MTKKNIAETNKFAEYLGIATDTLRGIMGNDCELPRRAEHKAIDMGKDGRLARERMRERLRRRPSRGHVDVIAWFLAFAPEYVRDDAELARAVNGTRTWAKASDLAREFDVSAKTLGRWARGEGRGKAGRVRSIRVRRTLLLRVDEIAGLRPKRRPTDGGIAGKHGTGDVEGPLDGLAPLRAVPTAVRCAHRPAWLRCRPFLRSWDRHDDRSTWNGATGAHPAEKSRQAGRRQCGEHASGDA